MAARLMNQCLLAESMTPEQRRVRKLRDLQDYVFLQGQIPTWVALSAYVALAAICMGVAPQLFPGVKAYYVLIGELRSLAGLIPGKHKYNA